jgi:hypothetical protein
MKMTATCDNGCTSIIEYFSLSEVYLTLQHFRTWLYLCLLIIYCHCTDITFSHSLQISTGKEHLMGTSYPSVCPAFQPNKTNGLDITGILLQTM